MSSASEKIRVLQAKQAADDAARKAGELDRVANVQRERQRVGDEHKRKLQRSKEIADRVLRESGVLDEIKAIQNNFLRSEKSDLYVNYYDDKTLLTLIWGRYKLKKDKGITNLNWHNVSAMIYSYIDAEVDVDSKGLRINGEDLTEQAWLLNRQTINDRLALAYLNPRSFSSYEGGYGDGDPHYIHN